MTSSCLGCSWFNKNEHSYGVLWGVWGELGELTWVLSLGILFSVGAQNCKYFTCWCVFYFCDSCTFYEVLAFHPFLPFFHSLFLPYFHSSLQRIFTSFRLPHCRPGLPCSSVAVHGIAKCRTRLSGFTFTFHFHALEKEMATHSSVLAWRIPGTGEPGGLPSMVSHRVGHDWSDLVAAAEAAGGASSNPGLARSPGEGNDNPLQYSCLGNLMDIGAWWATVHGVAKDMT